MGHEQSRLRGVEGRHERVAAEDAGQSVNVLAIIGKRIFLDFRRPATCRQPRSGVGSAEGWIGPAAEPTADRDRQRVGERRGAGG